MAKEELDLQQLTFFTEGNTFTGSKTKDRSTGKLLRYLVRQDKKEERLIAYAWTTDCAFERAQEKQEKEAPLTEAGLEEVQDWLSELYQAL